MAPTDENGRIRIRLRGKTVTADGTIVSRDDSIYGWATSAPANRRYQAGGYTIEWDDGFTDDPHTRWFFEGDGLWDIEAV